MWKMLRGRERMASSPWSAVSLLGASPRVGPRPAMTASLASALQPSAGVAQTGLPVEDSSDTGVAADDTGTGVATGDADSGGFTPSSSAPSPYNSDSTNDAQEPDQEKLDALRAQLTSLTHQRGLLRQQLASYQAVLASLQPGTSVWATFLNLVTTTKIQLAAIETQIKSVLAQIEDLG